MEAADKKQAAPPYVAYKTLSNFLDRFKQGLPGRIDRGLMASMSGAAQSQVTTALRYLGMISENGIPTQFMRDYATGEEAERKAALRAILRQSYPFIFESEFDFSTATASMLRERFAEYTTATGETLGRCMNFLKDAAADADIVVSPFLKHKQPRAPGVKKKPVAQRREEVRTPDRQKAREEHVPPPPPPPPAMPAQSSLLLSGLFQRLPKPGTIWAKADRDQWVQTLQNVLVMEYPES